MTRPLIDPRFLRGFIAALAAMIALYALGLT